MLKARLVVQSAKKRYLLGFYRTTVCRDRKCLDGPEVLHGNFVNKNIVNIDGQSILKVFYVFYAIVFSGLLNCIFYHLGENNETN